VVLTVKDVFLTIESDYPIRFAICNYFSQYQYKRALALFISLNFLTNDENPFVLKYLIKSI